MIRRPKIIGRGDLHAARQLIGEGKSQLAILKRQRALGLKDEYRQVKPYEGVIFECISDKWGDEVIITVLQQGKEGEQVGKKQYSERECYCFPHFAYGIITKVYPETPSDGFLLTGRFTYDIELCVKDIFVLYEGVYDANYGRYYKDQHVWLRSVTRWKSGQCRLTAQSIV